MLDKVQEDERGKVTRYRKGGQVGTYGPAGDADPDSLSFKEWFAAERRNAPGKRVGTWRGKKYLLLTKEELAKEGGGESKDKVTALAKKLAKGALAVSTKGVSVGLKKFKKNKNKNKK